MGLNRIIVVLALLASGSAFGINVVDDGFATRLNGTDFANASPGNKVDQVRAGQEFIHWVQYTGLPAGRTTLRCKLVEPDGTVQVDETEYHELVGEGFAFCAYDTDGRDAELGSLQATLWLNGERVSDRSLTVEAGGGRSSLYKEFKFWIGVLALAIVVGGWFMKKLRRGGGEEAPAKAAAGGPVVIGAKLQGGGAAAAFAAPQADDAEELRKCGLQFKTLIAQADKAKGLEMGRRYLALLVKSRDGAKAVEVFKECVAADKTFRLERGDDVLPIARAARAAGDPQTAVAAVRGFDKAFPGHASIPEVFMFSAKLLAEDLRNADMAKKILEHLVQKYPGHFVAPEAKRYLQAMPQAA